MRLAVARGAVVLLALASPLLVACGDGSTESDPTPTAGGGGSGGTSSITSTTTGNGGSDQGGASGGLVGGEVVTITSALPGGDAVVVLSDGGLLVGDPGTGTVQHVDPNTGEVTPFASGLTEPYGMSQDSSGTVYIADWGAQKVKTISPRGVVEDFQDVDGYVGNVFVDSADNVYIPFFYTGGLDRVTPGGERTQIAQLPLNEGFHGVLFDDNDQLFVGMHLSGALYKVDADGGYEPFAELPGTFGNMLLHRGAMFVTGYNAHQLFRISPDGEVEVFAGVGTQGGADGPALSASFNHPNGLAASADGNTLYISESGGRLRALSLVD